MKRSYFILIKALLFMPGFLVLFSLFLLSMAESRPDFVVLPKNDPFSDSAKYYLNYFHDKIVDLTGVPLDTTLTVYLASNEDEFQEKAGFEPPDWGAGVAVLNQNRIVIKSPKYMRVGKSFRELLGHELAHVMLHRAANGRWIPRWIHEGFAMYVSGEWRIGQDILVARVVWTGQLKHLTELEDLSTFNGAQADLAYTESYLAVSRLIKKSDPLILSDLLSLYRDNKNFHRSWKSTLGVDYALWVKNWHSSVSRQYHLFIFLFDNEVFWIILTLGFILLIIIKKRQNARTKRKWKRDEMLNPPDDNYRQYYDGYYDEENKI